MPKITRVEQTVPILKQKKKVAAYARISMETERMNHSLSAQISYYSSLIQRNPDWEYAGVFADDGISGTGIAKRGEFLRMIEAAENGKIDIILTKSIQRFARNTVDLLKTVRHLKDIGVEVRFEKENINSMSGDGELLLSILASFAQEESRSISENCKWGIKKKFEKGIPIGHFRIYGYRWEGEQLAIVPEEAAIVKRIFQNFLDGKSRRDGCRWVDSNIKVVLTNVTYTGNLLLQKEFIEDPISKHRKKNRGELTQYWVENTHEAVIDKAIFDHVQEEMKRRKELGPLANKSLNITCFTGKIKCEKCGKSLMRSVRNNKANRTQLGDKLVNWMCGTRKSGDGNCTTKEIPDRCIRMACAEALGIETFDEDIFVEKIDFISVPENGRLTFHFKDGSNKTLPWVNTSKKDAWTEEVRASVSKYRRNHPINREDISCLTTKIKCVQCGCNFRRATQSSPTSKTGKHHYWRCVDRNGCGTVGLREDLLKPILAEIIGIADFDEKLFNEQIDHIDVLSASEMVICFKDGRKINHTWIQPKREGKPWTEEQRAKFRESTKGLYTPERRKKMSEHMKKVRKERGKAWHKEQ